jgi:hypothetical protein
MRMVAPSPRQSWLWRPIVAAFAGERPSGSPRNSGPARGEMVSRPPALIPPSRVNATVAPETSSTDRHAAEFLRWKDRHAGTTR